MAETYHAIISFAANRARSISEGKAATKKVWEDERCSKHYGYRPGNRRVGGHPDEEQNITSKKILSVA
jgi:hypothetical protein